MRIRLIAVGSKMPVWIQEGYQEYSSRLSQDVRLELVEIPLGRRSKNAEVGRLQERESNQMLDAIGQYDKVISLDIIGCSWSTEQLSDKMAGWLQSGCNISLMIGGPEGLHDSCINRADSRWSLSPLTLPHPLVRIIVAEQVYRAWSILKRHPYHK